MKNENKTEEYKVAVAISELVNYLNKSQEQLDIITTSDVRCLLSENQTERARELKYRIDDFLQFKEDEEVVNDNKSAEDFLCNFMKSFFETHFENITTDLSKLGDGIPTTKKEFIQEVGNSFETAMWALTELAAWGMDKEYLQYNFFEMYDDENYSVIKIDGRYLKYSFDSTNYHIEFVSPKLKLVEYFE